MYFKYSNIIGTKIIIPIINKQRDNALGRWNDFGYTSLVTRLPIIDTEG